MKECEILLTPPEAKRSGILPEEEMKRRGWDLEDLAEFECGEPATVWVLFESDNEPQKVCSLCSEECQGMKLSDGEPFKKYLITLSRITETQTEYEVWATNEDEAGTRCLDGQVVNEETIGSCSKDDNPQIVDVEEVNR